MKSKNKTNERKVIIIIITELKRIGSHIVQRAMQCYCCCWWFIPFEWQSFRILMRSLLQCWQFSMHPMIADSSPMIAYTFKYDFYFLLIWFPNIGREFTLTFASDETVVSKNSWDWLLGTGSFEYPKPAYLPPWLGGKWLRKWMQINENCWLLPIFGWNSLWTWCILFLNPIEECVLLIAKLWRIEVLIAAIGSAILIATAKVLIAFAGIHWWAITVSRAGMLLWWARRQRTSVVLGRWWFYAPRFALSERGNFVTIQCGGFRVVFLLYAHCVIVVRLAVQEFTCLLIASDLRFQKKTFNFTISFGRYRAHKFSPSFFPIQYLSICPSTQNARTINEHQGHDVFPSILSKSKSRMSQTPIEDYEPHIQSISAKIENREKEISAQGCGNNCHRSLQR